MATRTVEPWLCDPGDVVAKVVVYGAYGHAKVVTDILALTDYKVVGLIDYRHQWSVGEIVAGYPVLAGV